MSKGADVSAAGEDEDDAVIEECLPFGDEFSADGGASGADGTDHLGIVVVEGDDDGGFDLAAGDGTHHFHGFLRGFGEAFGADLNGAVVVDVNRAATDDFPFESGVEDHLAVLV